MALGTAWAMRRCGSVVVAVDRFLAERHAIDSELGVAGVLLHLNW